MSKMKMPGFTAEASFYQTNGLYNSVGTFNTLAGSTRVVPQYDGLNPNSYFCAAACAICAGILVAPELLLPEAACAICIEYCTVGAG